MVSVFKMIFINILDAITVSTVCIVNEHVVSRNDPRLNENHHPECVPIPLETLRATKIHHEICQELRSGRTTRPLQTFKRHKRKIGQI